MFPSSIRVTRGQALIDLDTSVLSSLGVHSAGPIVLFIVLAMSKLVQGAAPTMLVLYLSSLLVEG